MMSQFTLTFILCLLSLSWTIGSHAAETAAADREKPNIILIMADDLGWKELGCYGQKKIKTPHIDRLASEGMKFMQFYAGSAVCAPSRCNLMTGMHGGHAYIRDNGEIKNSNPNRFGGQAPLPASVPNIAKTLKKKGYANRLFREMGPRWAGDNRRSSQARLRPLLWLQLPAQCTQSVSDLSGG